MRAPTGRMDPRVRRKLRVQLDNLEQPGLSERTLTENVSSLGIRVLTRQAWQPGQTLLITSPVGDLRTPARVVYCQPVGENQFAVGLQFQGPDVHWGKETGPSGGGA
jgi:hypothetical protein